MPAQVRMPTKIIFKNRLRMPSVFVDLVINHMSGHDSQGTGTDGSSYDGPGQMYPGVPYQPADFHQPFCTIDDYLDVEQVKRFVKQFKSFAV